MGRDPPPEQSAYRLARQRVPKLSRGHITRYCVVNATRNPSNYSNTDLFTGHTPRPTLRVSLSTLLTRRFHLRCWTGRGEHRYGAFKDIDWENRLGFPLLRITSIVSESSSPPFQIRTLLFDISTLSFLSFCILIVLLVVSFVMLLVISAFA